MNQLGILSQILTFSHPPQSTMRSLFSSARVLQTAPLATLALLSACSGSDDSIDSTAIDTTSDVATSPALSAGQKSELDGYLAEALGRYGVPGAAISIIRGRDVVYRGTFGVHGLSDPAPVTADTRFAVASVTKSMTTLMMATLVDDGKVSWNAPATDVLPAFGLSDPESTPRIRVRDLLNGTTGVPRLDTPFFVRSFTPTDLIRFVQTIPTVAQPGEVFGYSNAMASVGGYLGAVADGAEYDSAQLASGYERSLRERVLAPIGMNRTTLDPDVAFADADHAWPHSYDGARHTVVQTDIDVERFVTSVTPAGGAWSSLRDLEAYVSTQLSGVAPNGTRVVSTENLSETHSEAIANIPRDEWPTADRAGAGYGMGWFTLHEYRGMRALSHDGNTLGFTSELFLLPEADLGVVILTNLAQANPFYGAVEQFAVETALSLEHRGDALQAAANAQFEGLLEDITAQSTPVGREQVEPYLGAYEHDVRLEFNDQGFVLQSTFGQLPLGAFADSGLFVRTGDLAGRLFLGFDSDSAPTLATFGTPGEAGLDQAFVLRRIGD